jgi:hypothetical protein
MMVTGASKWRWLPSGNVIAGMAQFLAGGVQRPSAVKNNRRRAKKKAQSAFSSALTVK